MTENYGSKTAPGFGESLRKMIKNHRVKNNHHFESKTRLPSQNYGGKTVGVKS
jgi:hypothetical protein